MKKKLYYILSLTAALLTACTHDVAMVNLGIDDTYYVERMTKLPLQPAFTGAEYRWTLLRDNGADSILAKQSPAIFSTPPRATIYSLLVMRVYIESHSM